MQKLGKRKIKTINIIQNKCNKTHASLLYSQILFHESRIFFWTFVSHSQFLSFDVAWCLTHSQLLKGLKYEPKQKIAEEGGVGARSLAHNTLRGRGACWSSGMGLGRINKLHSLTRAYTQPTQSGQCIVGAPLVLRQATSNTDTQDSSRPRLGGSHHLPPYSILCGWPRSLHPNGFSLPGLPNGRPEIPPTGTPATLKPHNFASRPWIAMRSEAKLQLSSRSFQWYVARCLQTNKSGQFLTFSGRESNWQFDSRPFFWP